MVSKLLWDNQELCENKMEEYEKDLDIVEVIKNNVDYVAIVHPSHKNKKKVSAPIRLSNRMVSPKCCLCKGADMCIHLRIHKAHYDSQEKQNVENNSGDERTLRSNDANVNNGNEENNDTETNDDENDANFNEENNDIETNDDENNDTEKIRIHPNLSKDTSDKCTKEANPFKIRIPFPLSDEDQEKFREDSFKQNPYPDKFLYPQYNEEYRCECGYQMDKRDPFKMGWISSDQINIHHTRMVPDSRTTTLMAFYRPMANPNGPTLNSLCKHKVFYTGEQHHLLRVNSTGRKDICNFISYELLFTYFFLYFETGAGEKGFSRATYIFNQAIYNRNYASCDWHTWKNGWSIFCEAIDLGPESFDCYKCPEELADDAPENAELDYEEIECHVMDGIAMGNITTRF